MPFHPKKNGQYEPTTSTSAKDCVAATASMLVERAKVGAVRPTHVAIRAKSGAPASRGLMLSEAASAVKSLYGVTLEVKLGLDRTQVRDTIGNGRAAGVSIMCSVTVNTSRRTNSYTGRHLIFVSEYQEWPGGAYCSCEKRSNVRHGEFYVEDPGTTSAGYLWWSADLVYRAAEASGGGKISCLFGPDTESITWTANGAAQVRTQPTYSSGLTIKKSVIGAKYAGGATQNGGSWSREDRTIATGWVHIKLASGKWGWIKGRALHM